MEPDRHNGLVKAGSLAGNFITRRPCAKEHGVASRAQRLFGMAQPCIQDAHAHLHKCLAVVRPGRSNSLQHGLSGHQILWPSIAVQLVLQAGCSMSCQAGVVQAGQKIELQGEFTKAHGAVQLVLQAGPE